MAIDTRSAMLLDRQQRRDVGGLVVRLAPRS
jgi:hypothetical protein